MSKKKLPHALGGLQDLPDRRDILLSKLIKPIKSSLLKPVVNWESKMTPVKDQGNRGSCVSFATVAVKEFQEQRQRKFPKQPFDLSEEWVYRQIMQDGGGAYMRDGFKVLFNNGVPREKYFPYDNNASDDKKLPFYPPKNAFTNAKHYKAGSYARLSTIDEICLSIEQNGPVMVGIPWWSGWFYPDERKEGYYPFIKKKEGYNEGGHAFCLCGYNYPERYFYARNSWSWGWGKMGYFAISFDMIYDSYYVDAWTTLDQMKVNKAQVNKLVKEATS